MHAVEYEAFKYREVNEFMSTLAQRVFHEVGVIAEAIEDYRFPALIGTYLLFALLASKYRLDQDEYIFIPSEGIHVPVQAEKLLDIIIAHIQPEADSELGYRDIMENLFPKRPNEQITHFDLEIPHCLVHALELFAFEPEWVD